MATEISSEQAATLRQVIDDWLSEQDYESEINTHHNEFVAKVKALQPMFAEPFDATHCVHGDDCYCWSDD